MTVPIVERRREGPGVRPPALEAARAGGGTVRFDCGAPPSCVGDCDGDHVVTINELIAVVNIALAAANVSTCDAGDADTDGAITIGEIIQAVNWALHGCPFPPARAAASPGCRALRTRSAISMTRPVRSSTSQACVCCVPAHVLKYTTRCAAATP